MIIKWEEVEEQYNALKNGYRQDNDFKTDCKLYDAFYGNEALVDKYKNIIEANSIILASSLMVDSLVEEANSISDEEIKKRFIENRDKYILNVPRKIELKHIFYKDKSKFDELNEIKEQINNDIELFGTFALSHSECQSSLSRGLIGFVEYDALEEGIRDEIFGANIGEVVGPLESSRGVHLFFLCSESSARTLDIDKDFEAIKNGFIRLEVDKKVKEILGE